MNMRKCYKETKKQKINQPTCVDVEGNFYPAVTIGTQVWTIQNLRTTKYNDGTAIPHVADNADWSNLRTPGYCFYKNTWNRDHARYGALYNWYAVNMGKLAPAGWHVPTDAEWDILQNYLMMNGYNWDHTLTGKNKIGKSLADFCDWASSTKVGAVGDKLSKNNASGFSALPGGYRNFNGDFYYQSLDGLWWSATENDATYTYYRYLYYDAEGLGRNDVSKKCGFSVRLVKN